MNYKMLAVAAVIVCLVLIFSHASAQAPSSESTRPEPRFQIIVATVSEGISGASGQVPEDHTVFLLEQNSGRVWRYIPSVFAFKKDGSITGLPLDRHFEIVNADGFRGYDSKQAMREWMQQQKLDK